MTTSTDSTTTEPTEELFPNGIEVTAHDGTEYTFALARNATSASPGWLIIFNENGRIIAEFAPNNWTCWYAAAKIGA